MKLEALRDWDEQHQQESKFENVFDDDDTVGFANSFEEWKEHVQYDGSVNNITYMMDFDFARIIMPRFQGFMLVPVAMFKGKKIISETHDFSMDNIGRIGEILGGDLRKKYLYATQWNYPRPIYNGEIPTQYTKGFMRIRYGVIT